MTNNERRKIISISRSLPITELAIKELVRWIGEFREELVRAVEAEEPGDTVDIDLDYMVLDLMILCGIVNENNLRVIFPDCWERLMIEFLLTDYPTATREEGEITYGKASE